MEEDKIVISVPPFTDVGHSGCPLGGKGTQGGEVSRL